MHTTLADVIMTHLEALANQLTHILPWAKHLNDDERADLLADLSQACTQARHTGQTDALLEVLEDWEATAHCVGDKQLTDRLLVPTVEQDYKPW